MALISVITTVLNARTTIRDCIESVISQGVDVEHIMIDGCSTDGTLEVINEYRSILAKIVSEKDNSLYEGMNKGIALATSDIIGILNADDVYADENVLKVVLETFRDNDVDSCYGDLIYVDENNISKIRRLWRAGEYSPKRFYRGWMPPHPTLFVRKRIYEKFGVFNIGFGSAADYELMVRFFLKHNVSSVYIPEVLVKMRTGGKSNSSVIQRIKANRNDKRAWQANGITPLPWTFILKPLSKINQFIFKKL